MKHEEHDLQAQCVRWFRIQFPKLTMFAIPNGGRRSMLEAVRLKKEGVLAGIPDLFLAYENNKAAGLFIEMKSKKGRPTRKQNDMKVKLETAGYKVALCRSFEEFEETIRTYLGE